MNFVEHIRIATDALKANKVRSALTMIGMIIGTAAVVAVVSIGLGGKDFVLKQIEGLGSNLIVGRWEGMIGRGGTELVEGRASKDITLEDIKEMTQRADAIKSISPVMMEYTPLYYEKKERQVMVMGVNENYKPIRNLEIKDGRFFSAEDDRLMRKICVITPVLAQRMFTGENPIGKSLKIKGLAFEVVGIYSESSLFGGPSQAMQEAILVPIGALNYFAPVDRVDMFFAQARSPEEVSRAVRQTKEILEKNHRAGKEEYLVEGLESVLAVVNSVATALALIIGFIAAISLVVGGVGIMNIMLVSVTERTREIGIRMAVGAERRDILLQFLIEAVVLSLFGGFIGILIGAGIPLLVSLVTHFPIPVSFWAAVVAFVVSLLVGVVFGLYPANKASRLDPIESLRYE